MFYLKAPLTWSRLSDRSSNAAGKRLGNQRMVGCGPHQPEADTLSHTVKKQHRKALALSKVRPFVPYSLRHTFLARLGDETGNVCKVMMAAGHSSVAMSQRYVHLHADSIQNAMERLGG